ACGRDRVDRGSFPTRGSSDLSASFDTKDVGAGKTVTASGYALGGADAGNYSLASPQGTTSADIAAKGVTVSGAKANDKTYDANTNPNVDRTNSRQPGVLSADT